MTTYENIRRRIRDIEEARGAGALTVTHNDGSKEGFNLTRNERLKVLLASFSIARQARNPEAPAPSDTRFTTIARAVGKATEVRPPSRLWQSVAAIVQGAEEDAKSLKLRQ